MRVVVMLGVIVCSAFIGGADAKDRKPIDPNKVICRSEEVIGSRLQTSKRCLTAQQWDQMEREQRETVERVQSLRTNDGH